MSRLLTYSILQQHRSPIASSDAVFSTLKIMPSYTGYCMKVRRSSDNTTQDIGFVNDILDTTSLLSFVGSVNGFVDTWYDQKGLRNATQSTTGNQFQIVVSGVVVTASNGYPSCKSINTSNTHMTFTSIDVQSAFVVADDDGASGSSLFQLLGRDLSGNGMYNLRLYTNGYYRTSYDTYDFHDAANALYVNGSYYDLWGGSLHLVTAFRTGGAATIGIISPYNNTRSWEGKIQTIILYGADKSSDRISIENVIGSQHSIYLLQNGDLPSMGTPVDISAIGDSVVLNEGTTVFAYSYGHTGTALTINGVTFTKANLSGWTSYAHSSIYARGGLGTDFESLMDSFVYAGTSIDYLISGLIPGKHYKLQIFTADDRLTNRTVSYTISNQSSGSFYTHQKGSIICSFQARNTQIIMSCTGSAATYLNGIQLRQLD